MEERIRGSFPGGPQRVATPEEYARAPRLHRVEDIEAGVARRRLQLTRRRRRLRVVGGLVVALGLAGSVGVVVGLKSHATPAELTEAQQARQSQEMDVSENVNRALLELWKMEDVEYMRNSNRR